jgi:hypothetical protein
MALKGIPWLAVSLALTSVDVTVLSFWLERHKSVSALLHCDQYS